VRRASIAERDELEEEHQALAGLRLVLADALAGQGVALIDPHGIWRCGFSNASRPGAPIGWS
jgi:hypothetical protein